MLHLEKLGLVYEPSSNVKYSSDVFMPELKLSSGLTWFGLISLSTKNVAYFNNTLLAMYFQS